MNLFAYPATVADPGLYAPYFPNFFYFKGFKATGGFPSYYACHDFILFR